MQRKSKSHASVDEREPEAGDDRLGKPRRFGQDEASENEVDDADREIGVAHHLKPLPAREEEEEELSEADILEELDLDELDAKA